MKLQYRKCCLCGGKLEFSIAENAQKEDNGYMSHGKCHEIWEDLRYCNAKQAIKLVNSIDSTEKLELLIGIEIRTDNRNTVVDATHNRLLKLEGVIL